MNKSLNTSPMEILHRALPYLTLVGGALLGGLVVRNSYRRDPNFERARQEGFDNGYHQGQGAALRIIHAMNPAPVAPQVPSVTVIDRS